MLKKKLVAAVCSVAMIFSSIAFAAPVVKDNAQNITSSNVKLFANEGTFGDNLTWSINDKTLTIGGTGDMPDWTTTSYINAPWCNNFENVVNIVNIVINDGITGIGDLSFLACKNLIRIKIPASVIHIGNGVFGGCDSLTDIYVDSNNPQYKTVNGVLLSKDETELYACPAGNTNLYYNIPNTVTHIKDGAFSSCKGLTNISVASSVISIEDYAFEFCNSLSGIFIPSSVTNIGENIFFGDADFTIYGEAGSAAETYAQENSISFNAITPVVDSEYYLDVSAVKGEEAAVYETDFVAKIGEVTLDKEQYSDLLQGKLSAASLIDVIYPNNITSMQDVLNNLTFTIVSQNVTIVPTLHTKTKPISEPTLPESGELINLNFNNADLTSSSSYGKAEGIETPKFVEIDGRKCLQLDGTKSTAIKLTDINGNSLLSSWSNLSISFKVKPTSTFSWWFYAAPNNNKQTYGQEKYLGAHTNGTSLNVERYNNSGERSEMATGIVKPNEWNDVVINVKDNCTDVYVNSVKQSSVSSTVDIADMLGDTSVAYIGLANWGTGEYGIGYIDDFVISIYPTVEPTTEPTSEPTATPTPTIEPTSEPTATPTLEPTPTPTIEPTATPTTPTATPTVKPTTEPTATPTVEPTTEPTATPTAEPTIDTTPTPTLEPTPTPKPTPLPVANSTLKIKGAVRNGNTITGIKITGETDSPSAIGIVAVYDYQGKLKGMSKTKSELLVEAGTYDLSQPIAYDDTDTYKIFVWNGISEIALQPLAKAYVKPEYEYSIATVGKVKDLQEMTVSNNGDIYYRTDTSKIYKMNAETGTSTVFLDTSSMNYQLDNISYSDFMILSIAYNNYSDKLYMFGRYTTRDFTNEKGSCAIYEITDGNAGEPIYFDKGTSQVPTSDNYYFKHIDFLNADEMYLELYKNTYIMDLNDYSTIDVNSNTGRYGYVFYGDGDLYSFNTYTAGLYFVGSYTSPKNNQLKSIASWQKATSDNYSLGGNYPPTNHKGYTVYNEKPYYVGRPEDNSKPTGDIYYMDLEGNISRFINAVDVEQRGNNTVDISCLDFFTMDYEGLPMWYDSDLGVIKRYVRN